MDARAVRLVVADDLRRSRLTVLLRLLLAVPHYVLLGVWTLAAVFVVIANWVATLVRGTPPNALHGFLVRYIRYSTHVNAYLFLAANPYPPFTGERGLYPVDVEIGPPERQNRWTVGFRLVLAVPAFIVVGALVGAGGNFAGGRSGGYVFAGVAATIGFLAWFACLALGRMPQGFRDVQAYALRYVAEFDAYLFIVTGRYPTADPAEPVPPQPPPEHPIALSVGDDLRRSRLTTFFRLLLAIPHLVWLSLWSVVALVAAVVQWVVTLASARPARSVHRFLAAYVRYSTHVAAFLYLVANPFPGFTGASGRYPIDVVLPEPERQNRWVTGFRGLLAVPALVVGSAIGNLVAVAAFLGWFAALATGRMPSGLRNAGAYVLRYSAQLSGYLLFLTARYPFSGPSA